MTSLSSLPFVPCVSENDIPVVMFPCDPFVAKLKSLSGHPDALSTFDSQNLLRLADGKVPSGWQVHHKIPQDDTGTNALDNLILIQNLPYHSALSKTQAIITKDLPYNANTNVLWPSPNGVIYPVGK